MSLYNFYGTLGTVGTVVITLLVLFFGFCVLFMPIFVWQIKNQAIRTNKLLEQILAVSKTK